MYVCSLKSISVLKYIKPIGERFQTKFGTVELSETHQQTGEWSMRHINSFALIVQANRYFWTKNDTPTNKIRMIKIYLHICIALNVHMYNIAHTESIRVYHR